MPRLTQGFKASCRIRGYHPLWPAFPNRSAIKLQTTGLVRVRSPLLAESLLMSFPPATEMFQFAGFASAPYVFRNGSVRRLGLPHSDIRESTNARFSSRLFAACHVLHRLSVPRHPPDALITLDLSPLTVLTARRDKPCRTMTNREDTSLRMIWVSIVPVARLDKTHDLSKETLGSHISTISNSNFPIFSDRTDRRERRSNSCIP